MAVAYLVSQYPAPSHTFITREVAALRRAGVGVATFTVRPCPEEEILSPVDATAKSESWAIVSRPKGAMVVDQLVALASAPARYFSTLAASLRQRNPGLRNALWALFYFIESIVLARELKQRNITHLHCHFANAASQVAILTAHYLDIPWSMTLHGHACFNTDLTSLLGKKISHSRFTACVSDYGRAQAKHASDPAHWAKIIRVNCGLDLSALPETSPTVNARLRIVCVARLVAVKGQIDLLTAFAKVIAAGIDAELVLYGDGPMRDKLSAMIERLNLAEHCRMPGAISVGRALQEIADADIFVLSSFMEGLPVSLMEAMAVGTTVVAPRLAGIPELVEDGVNGLLYTPARPDQLAEHLQTLLTDEQTRAKLNFAARRTIEQSFTIERAIAPLLPFFVNQEK